MMAVKHEEDPEQDLKEAFKVSIAVHVYRLHKQFQVDSIYSPSDIGYINPPS